MRQFRFYSAGTCKKECEKFRAIKPSTGGRYEAGQARCQICDIWLTHKGCHQRNGSQATLNSEGWFCDCCRSRVRRNPRHGKEKSLLRAATQSHEDTQSDPTNEEIDMEYFNNYRALLLKKLAKSIPRKKTDFYKKYASQSFNNNNLSELDIKNEFNCSLDKLIDLAYSDDPNKISLTVDFEHIKSMLGRVPAKGDLETHSRFHVVQYEVEFGTLEQLLNRLGYDPWYRKGKNDSIPKQETLKNLYSKRPKFKNNNLHTIRTLNRFIEKALVIIKSNPDGIKMIDLGIELDLSYDEMSYLSKRLVRLDGMEISPDKIIQWRDVSDLTEPVHDVLSTDSNIPALARRMLDEYSDGRNLNKHLRQRLTQEYVACRSISQVMRNNPNLREKEILLHVRTSLRLPSELKEMENRGDLHPDPDFSLRIALFAVNHYKWDGEKKTEKDVVNLARAISDYVVSDEFTHGRAKRLA